MKMETRDVKSVAAFEELFGIINRNTNKKKEAAATAVNSREESIKESPKQKSVESVTEAQERPDEVSECEEANKKNENQNEEKEDEEIEGKSIKEEIQSFAENAEISKFGARGKQGRRLTFRMQQVPDVLVKGSGDKFIEDCKELVGSNIFTEADDSDDDAWTPEEIQNQKQKIAAEPTKEELEEILTFELLAANDETDRLSKFDSLSSPSEALKNQKDLLDKVNDDSAAESEEPTEAATEVQQGKSTMDILQLRLWYMKVRKSYEKSVKIIKISNQGLMFVRVIQITADFLILSRSETLNPRKCHLAAIKKVNLGFASDAFRKLLSKTPENQPVPPPQNCVVILLPNQTNSFVLPSEEARNEFLLVLRVLVKQAKRLYGDQSKIAASIVTLQNEDVISNI